MHVLEPKELELRRKQRSGKRKTKRVRVPLRKVLVVLVVVFFVGTLVLPLPTIQARMLPLEFQSQSALALPWPSYGQAAVGAVGYGILAKNGDQKPVSIASMAKVITALAVLKVKPMQPGGFGETLVITGPDVDTYFAYASQGQSVIRVQVGQDLTQYQALQALLLPSANNMADVLVRWAFGSTEEYLAFVNPFVATLGLSNTKIADASGFSPETVSTATDMLKLAEIAMNSPLIAEIVAQPQAELPVAGTVYNVNYQLGSGGIVGIKTGNTDQAGGCYLFAAKRSVDGSHPVTVIGVVMGAPVLSRAIDDSMELLEAAARRFSVVTPVHANQPVGHLTQSWGANVEIVVKDSIEVVSWNGVEIHADTALNRLNSTVADGSEVGTLTLEVGNKTYSSALVAGGTITRPAYLWRLRYLSGLLASRA